MDVSYEFYLYSALVYLPAAIFGSWYFTRTLKIRKPKNSASQKAAAAEKSSIRKKAYLKPGLIGYCTYCDRFLMNEEFVTAHLQGKRHVERAAGATTWLELRRPEDATQEKKPDPPKPKPVESAESIADRKHRQKMQGSGEDKFAICKKSAKPKAK